MSNVAILPTQLSAEAAWERYSALVRQATDDNRLWADRQHCEAVFRAHEEFRKVFLALEAA